MQTYSTKRIRLLLICIVLLVGCVQPCRAAASGFELTPNTRHLVIAGGLKYLIEDAPLDPKLLTAEPLNAGWRPVTGERRPFGIRNTPAWYRFDVINRNPRQWSWLLEIGWPMLNRVEVHLFNHVTRAWSDTQTAGRGVSIGRQIFSHRQFLLPLSIPPEQPITVFVRVDRRHPSDLTLDLWQARAFGDSNQQRILLLGLFFGILTIMALYNMSLYCFTRDSNYLFYAFHGTAVIFYALAATGLGSRYVWGASDYLREVGYTLFACLGFLSGVMFVRQFLSLKHYGGWIYQKNNVLLVIWALAIPFYLSGLFPFAAIWAIKLSAIVTSLAGMVTGVYLWIKGNRQAKYFTIAFAFLSGGTIVQMLGSIGVMQYGVITEYSQIAGFVFELVVLSIALADQIDHERASREEAQSIALDLSQKISKAREEKLMVQEQMLVVQRRAKEDLEIRVLERTNELERTMKNLEIANKELSKLSLTDPLTKVFNRRHFDQVLNSEMKRSSRTQQPLSVAIADIDHFKSINDNHGHLIGDECLRLVARTLRRQLGRITDLIARFGGEEFVFVLPSTPQENAMIVAERARCAVADIDFIHRGKRIRLSVSIGVAGWVPSAKETPYKMIHSAELALSSAKTAGRNKTMAANLG